MHMKAAAFGIFLALAAGHAHAQGDTGPRTAPGAGRVSFVPFLGTDMRTGGDLTRGVSAVLPGGRSIANIVLDADTRLVFDKLRFEQAFQRPAEFGVSGAYGVWDNGEIFGTVRHVRASGRKAEIGKVFGEGFVFGRPFELRSPILAAPSNYSALSAEAGYRHFLATGSAFLPYVAGAAGLTRTSGIDADIFVQSIASGELAAGRIRLYDTSLSPTASIQIGLTYAFAPSAAIGVETGLRYEGKLRGNDRDISLGNGGLTALNEEGGRWSMPLRVTGRIAF
jgi:hypothetical protein